jgi:hypothetical protein
MGTQKHLHIVQMLQIVVIDSDESHALKSLTLHPVVHDITQTVESGSLRQFFLGFADGSGHTETESTAAIYFYLHFLGRINFQS